MTPQTLISLDVSPKKCHFFTELYICEKIIGRVTYSMNDSKQTKGWWGNITEHVVSVPIINHYHNIAKGEICRYFIQE